MNLGRGLTFSETQEPLELSETHGPMAPQIFSSLDVCTHKDTQHKFNLHKSHCQIQQVYVYYVHDTRSALLIQAKTQQITAAHCIILSLFTLTSRTPPKAMRKSPFKSLLNTLWKVCLNREVLKESPITMCPLLTHHNKSFTRFNKKKGKESHIVSLTVKAKIILDPRQQC